MSDGIILHKEKGLNPHLSICPRCGQKTNEIILLGRNNSVFKCLNCGQHVIAHRKTKCPSCGGKLKLERELGDSERVAGMNLCDNCQAQVDMVKKGGIFFKCKDCSAIGAIRPDHPLSKEVREKLGVEPPKPCGIEFDKSSCPVCTGAVEPPGDKAD